MSRPHILRLPRTDLAEPLLLNVTQHKNDLKLVGTDQEHLYHATIKASSIERIQANNFSGTLDEWKAIINFVFLQQRDENTPEEAFQGCETAATIDKSVLTINIRKNIGGIIQRLGTVKLEQDDEREAVSAFDWVDAAVATSDELRQQLEILQTSVSSQQDQIANLNAQLDQLVKAKKDHEEELLKKFVKLINAKKLKIRDQQRLLQKAKVDPDAAQAVHDTRTNTSGHSRIAEPSRGGKRKVQAAMEEESEGTAGGEDDAENSDGSRPRETPPGSEDEAAPIREEQLAEGVKNDNMDLDDLPPTRELPFKTRASNSTRARETSDTKDDDEADEETDDEL